MVKLLTSLVVALAAFDIIFLSLFAYKNIQQTAQYSKEVLGAKTTYYQLRKSYDNYKEQNKISKQIIAAKGQDSENIQIADIINRYIKKVQGDISIYYKNLTSDESVIVDEDKKYYMASLYKVILTLFILDQIKSGLTTIDAKIGTTNTTIEAGLNKIITESNNEYAQILAREYGWNEIEKAMKPKLGIDFTFNKDLEINVKNVGLLFENIALSLKLTDDQNSYILHLLKDQKKTSKLPKYLPETIYSHNKTGEFGEYSHDAGIFYTPKANYILVFMSKTKLPGITNEQMALMSKEIYESLNGITK